MFGLTLMGDNTALMRICILISDWSRKTCDLVNGVVLYISVDIIFYKMKTCKWQHCFDMTLSFVSGWFSAALVGARRVFNKNES